MTNLFRLSIEWLLRSALFLLALCSAREGSYVWATFFVMLGTALEIQWRNDQ